MNRRVTRAARLVALALAAAGCGHAKDAEVTATIEQPKTIGYTFTADLARLEPIAPGDATGVRGLLALIAAHFGAVGQPGPLPAETARGPLELRVELPAPGWALRARVVPKPEDWALITVEPIATEPAPPHAVGAAPWSVQRAYDEVRLGVAALRPPAAPPMDAARFARLRAEAAAAARAGRDPLLTPEAYVRVPRPISSAGAEAPYYTPPVESQSSLEPK